MSRHALLHAEPTGEAAGQCGGDHLGVVRVDLVEVGSGAEGVWASHHLVHQALLGGRLRIEHECPQFAADAVCRDATVFGDEVHELRVLHVHTLAVDGAFFIGHVAERVAEVLPRAAGQVLPGDAALGLNTRCQDVAGQSGHFPIPVERPEDDPDAAHEGAVVGDDQVGRRHRIHATGRGHRLHVGHDLPPGPFLVADHRVGDRPGAVDAAAGGVHQQQHARVVVGLERVQLLGDLVPVGAGGEHRAVPGAVDGTGDVQRKHCVGRVGRSPDVLVGRGEIRTATARGPRHQAHPEQANQEQGHRDHADTKGRPDADPEAAGEWFLRRGGTGHGLRGRRGHPDRRGRWCHPD